MASESLAMWRAGRSRCSPRGRWALRTSSIRRAPSGDADRESRDDVRFNGPLAVQTSDRLVPVQDYANFARTFAAIGKATGLFIPTSEGRPVVLEWPE